MVTRWKYPILMLMVQGSSTTKGYGIDEEMINLDKFQQMLEAATRYLQVLTEVNDTIMNLGI